MRLDEPRAAATGAAGFGGSGALPPLPGLLARRVSSANSGPGGSAICRFRACRSTNCRATISSIELDALFTSMPVSCLSRVPSLLARQTQQLSDLVNPDSGQSGSCGPRLSLSGSTTRSTVSRRRLGVPAEASAAVGAFVRPCGVSSSAAAIPRRLRQRLLVPPAAARTASTVSASKPGSAASSSGSAASTFSTVSYPAARSAATTSSWMSGRLSGCDSTAASPNSMPASCSSTSLRFSSSLLMSIFQPVSLAASRTFWPFLPIASDSCRSSTTTSITRCSSSTMLTRWTRAGLRAPW